MENIADGLEGIVCGALGQKMRVRIRGVRVEDLLFVQISFNIIS